MILLQLVRLAVTTYKAMGFLCADVKDGATRDPLFALATPPLNRTILEIVVSVLYLLEDLPRHTELFYRAGWRDEEEMLIKYRESHLPASEHHENKRASRSTSADRTPARGNRRSIYRDSNRWKNLDFRQFAPVSFRFRKRLQASADRRSPVQRLPSHVDHTSRSCRYSTTRSNEDVRA